MTGKTVNGSGNGARSGAQTLVLLAAPLNASILRALTEGPKRQAELRRRAGSPAETTLRAQLRRLTEVGAVNKQRRNRFPGVMEYELTIPGHDLLLVVDQIERWLALAAERSLTLGDSGSKAAIKALADGWSSTMLRVLAAGPRSLTELDRLIVSLSYPSLERRLGTLRLAGQVEPCQSNGRSTPYAVTGWLRQGVAPLLAAARWERSHRREDAVPIGRLEIEAAFLLALPLVSLPNQLSGTCRLAVEMHDSRGTHLAGVQATADTGRIVSCTTRLEGEPDTSARGSTDAWLSALFDGDDSRLGLDGERGLGRALLDALRAALNSQCVTTG